MLLNRFVFLLEGTTIFEIAVPSEIVGNRHVIGAESAMMTEMKSSTDRCLEKIRLWR
jgi:hypothetical protein